MKIRYFLLVIVASVFVACKDSSNTDKAKIDNAKTESQATGGEYKIDTTISIITWLGKKVTGQHKGTLNLSHGNIVVANDAVTGGSFIINVNSLKATDASPEDNAKLTDHLLSADFFDIAKFPTAKFIITGVAAYIAPADTTQKVKLAGATHTVTGNLTLKDVTKSITFPAKITVSTTTVNAESKFTINRNDFGMTYGTDPSMKDKMLMPDVEIGFNITAKK